MPGEALLRSKNMARPLERDRKPLRTDARVHGVVPRVHQKDEMKVPGIQKLQNIVHMN